MLTLSEARARGVCRICGEPETASWENPFVYNFGREYAHKACLEAHQTMSNEDSHDRLSEIERALNFGVPTLTLEEQRWLFELATGKKIVAKKRCEECGGEGQGGHYSEPTEIPGVYQKPKCHACQGSGYINRE